MYIIFGTIIILIIVLFGTGLLKIFKSYASQTNTGSSTGNIWFITLLLINIFIICFIYSYYYYKISLEGNKGPDGPSGLSGTIGNDCIIPEKINLYYQKYNSINAK